MAKPGIYRGMPMSDYLAIPALSGSVLDTLLDECPKKAWSDSFLNPDRVREESDLMDKGTIAHCMLLEGGIGKFEVIDPCMYPTKSSGNIPDGWTNKDIKAARDLAREQGMTPILKPKYEEVAGMHPVAQQYIAACHALEPELTRAFGNDGESEVALVWMEGETLCKARTDRQLMDGTLIVNYKTTSGSVDPDKWGRTALPDYMTSAAFYIRAAKALYGVDAKHLFLCQEFKAPHLCSLIGLNPEREALAHAKAARGIRMWQECVKTGVWPAYPARACYPELPPWEAAREVERQIEDGVDYASQG